MFSILQKLSISYIMKPKLLSICSMSLNYLAPQLNTQATNLGFCHTKLFVIPQIDWYVSDH